MCLIFALCPQLCHFTVVNGKYIVKFIDFKYYVSIFIRATSRKKMYEQLLILNIDSMETEIPAEDLSSTIGNYNEPSKLVEDTYSFDSSASEDHE